MVDNDDLDKGKVYGSALYKKGDTVPIVAIPNEGYVFEKWSDGDTNPIREIKVDSDISYTAYFEEKTKYYALDKVEVYIEEDFNGISTKKVEYHGLDIYNSEYNGELSPLISTGAGSVVKGLELGTAMVDTNVISGTVYTNIYADEETPIVFYSARNDANSFAGNSTLSLSLEFDYNCHSTYTNNGSVFYDNNFNNHSFVNKKSSLSFEITQETTKRVLLSDESAHGYKIYANLHFIEI